MALVLAFVLALSTQGAGFYERQFVWLFWLNFAVAALLGLVFGWWRCGWRYACAAASSAAAC